MIVFFIRLLVQHGRRYFQAKHEKEEEERKKRIQLYVFVLRSIAYTFNAKQSSDMQKRNLKVSKEGHEKMKSKVDVSATETFFLFLLYPSFLWKMQNPKSAANSPSVIAYDVRKYLLRTTAGKHTPNFDKYILRLSPQNAVSLPAVGFFCLQLHHCVGL